MADDEWRPIPWPPAEAPVPPGALPPEVMAAFLRVWRRVVERG